MTHENELRRYVAECEHARQSQPERLAEVRARAEAEKQKALAAEPWIDMVGGLPTFNSDGELSGMFSLPTIDGKELYGARLAFDLVGCCSDEEQVRDKLAEYFVMIGKPEHAFLVAFAALGTIANYVVPVVLDTLEHQAKDYETRVRLADAARNAWAARVADLEGGGPAGG